MTAAMIGVIRALTSMSVPPMDRFGYSAAMLNQKIS